MFWLVVFVVVLSLIWHLSRRRRSAVPVSTVSAGERRRRFEAEAEAFFERQGAQPGVLQSIAAAVQAVEAAAASQPESPLAQVLQQAVETAVAAPAKKKRREHAKTAPAVRLGLSGGPLPALDALPPFAALRARPALGALPARVPMKPITSQVYVRS